MKCNDTLTIHKNGAISTDGCGYSQGYGIGQGEFGVGGFAGGGSYGTAGSGHFELQAFLPGEIYGDKRLKKLYLGSPDGMGNRGGGIIEIIANRVIIKGNISCCGKDLGGSGGSIKIVAKRIENHGTILAKGGDGSGDG